MSGQEDRPIESEDPLFFVLSGEDKGLSGFLQAHPKIELVTSGQSRPEVPYIHGFVISQESFNHAAHWLSKFSDDDPILCQKVLILNGNSKPDRNILSYFNEFGTERIFSGQKRGLQLKNYIDKSIEDKELVGSSYYYRYELYKSLKENNHTKSISLLKNFWISFEGISTNRIASSVYMQTDDTKIAKQHLKGILKETPNMLWAAWDLLNLYHQKLQNHDALMVAQRLSAYNKLNVKRMKIHVQLLYQEYYFTECSRLCDEILKDTPKEDRKFFQEMKIKSEKAQQTYQSWIEKYEQENTEDKYCPPPLKEAAPITVSTEIEDVQEEELNNTEEDDQDLSENQSNLKDPVEVEDDSDDIEIEIE